LQQRGFTRILTDAKSSQLRGLPHAKEVTSCIGYSRLEWMSIRRAAEERD
jgi:hypothetical protein